MGSFVFKWPHPDAKDVHVTGTFDDWGKSEQLHKIGDFWEKEVNLPSADEKYYYKFVVDDDWVIDPTAPQEDDGHYNINNVLLPKDIKRHAAGSTGAAAAAAPSSSKVENATPGGFPETPANEQQQAFGVAPIPASSGIGNPIKLAPGEKVPEQGTVTDHTVDSTASTSKEGYERDASAALPAAGAVTGMGGLAALVGSVFSRNENKQNVIPESSLPMGGDKKDTMDSGPQIQSAAPNSSTAALAAGVPLEEKRDTRVIDSADTPQTGVETAAGVPEPVKESISEAQQSPEAAGSAEAVKEKSAMEQELLKKTTTSEPTDISDLSPAEQSSYYGLATQVPPTVEKSMQQAHVPPEAAADSSAVAEKSAMESELLKKVPSSDVAGEPAPTIAAATSETAPSATANTPAAGAASGFTTDEKVAGGAVGGMAAAGVVTAFASKEKEPEAPQAVPASGTAPTGSKEDPVPTTDSLSKDEKVAGGAAGGMAAAGTVGALASNKEKEQEASQAVPASGSTPIGSKDAAVPTTDSLSEKEKVAGGAVGGMAAAGTVGALASSEGAGQTSTGGGAPPSDQPAGAIGTLGGKSSAAAAVADGTDSAEVPTASKAPVALEKTEGDAAEYAPVTATKTVPGVSPIAAAAMSDGTEDPTLADEPAVKMMQQDETNDLGTGAASAHDATTTTGVQAKEASSAVPPTSNQAETTTVPLSTSDAANATTGDSGLTTAAGTTTATTGAGNEMFAPHRGSVSAYDSGDRAAATAAPTSDKKEERTSTMGPTGSGTMRTTPGASSTPVKKTAAGDISTSSPASSANTKERKKRNRLSRLYHKLID